VLTVTDASSHAVSYEHDKLNRLTKITYPDSSYEQFAYDDAGNKTSWRKQDANSIYYVYNDANLLTTIDYPTGTDTTFTYNGNAQRTQMADAAGTTGYSYDSAGRLSTVTDVHGKTITYSYPAFPQHGEQLWPRLRRGQPTPPTAPLGNVGQGQRPKDAELARPRPGTGQAGGGRRRQPRSLGDAGGP